MAERSEQRPELTPSLTGAELQRWYWLKSELIDFARALDMPTGGSKDELTVRVAAALDGKHRVPMVRRRAVTVQLGGELSRATVIPPGQRASQHLRKWFTAQLGPSFHFDRHMRDFVASADGARTLGDALDHWRSTRDQPTTTIDSQFELNRFTRTWHEQNPGGTRAELLADWRTYRSLPVDARGRA